jgi:hypothetical protein
MMFLKFSFKNEAIWSMAFTLAGLAVGLLAFLLVYLIRGH